MRSQIYRRLFTGIVVTVILIPFTSIFARTPINQNPTETPQQIMEAFRTVRDVSTPQPVVVPTVIQVPLDARVTERGEIAIYDETAHTFVPYLLKQAYTTSPVTVTADTHQGMNGYALVDGDSHTNINFTFDEQKTNTAIVTLTGTEPFTSSELVLGLDRYVALPTRISISARVNGTTEETILAPITPDSNVITFPETRANVWTITMTYAQPLRINELRLVQDVENRAERSVRFLAQPHATYKIFEDADRSVNIQTLERGDLSNDTGVLKIPETVLMNNELYREADTDHDTIADIHDNCVQTANADQTDIDHNGRGDACDDFDRDGVMQNIDNCPNITNAAQTDTDNDGKGDSCDTEESRITEKYPWVPWAGMGIATLVLGVLFVLVGVAPKQEREEQV